MNLSLKTFIVGDSILSLSTQTAFQIRPLFLAEIFPITICDLGYFFLFPENGLEHMPST